MRQKQVKVGGRYWTNVSGQRVEVEVVQERRDSWSNRTKFLVRRVDNGQLLPKARSPSALHPRGDTYWPGMTEKQELEGVGHFRVGDRVSYRGSSEAGEVTYVWPSGEVVAVLWDHGHGRPRRESAGNLKRIELDPYRSLRS